jgi:hypothetical protein
MTRQITFVDRCEYEQFADTGTFIEKFGYVQYQGKLPYPRTGSCEVLGCGIHKTFGSLIDRALFVGNLEQAYAPFLPLDIDTPAEQIEYFLEIGLRRKQYLDKQKKPGFVFDHCHAHGWIRGIVCASCNGKMRNVDLRMDYTEKYIRVQPDSSLIEIELPTPSYAGHWEKCPDCRMNGPWTALLGGMPTHSVNISPGKHDRMEIGK